MAVRGGVELAHGVLRAEAQVRTLALHPLERGSESLPRVNLQGNSLASSVSQPVLPGTVAADRVCILFRVQI